MGKHGKLAIATVGVIAGARVSGARWDPPTPADRNFSGFSVWSATDAEELDGLSGDELAEKLGVVCVACLIEGHPEAGVLLDRARVAPDHIAEADD